MQRDPRAYLSDVLEAAAAIQEATSTIGEALKQFIQRDPQLFAALVGVAWSRALAPLFLMLTQDHQDLLEAR